MPLFAVLFIIDYIKSSAIYAIMGILGVTNNKQNKTIGIMT